MAPRDGTSYVPKPIDTSGVTLSPELLELIERLAENIHDNWALQRLGEGWTFGPERSDEGKRHPDLVPYEQLTHGEQEYDRRTVMAALKAVVALGYQIVPPDEAAE